mgnify:FL=1
MSIPANILSGRDSCTCYVCAGSISDVSGNGFFLGSRELDGISNTCMDFHWLVINQYLLCHAILPVVSRQIRPVPEIASRISVS